MPNDFKITCIIVVVKKDFDKLERICIFAMLQ